MPKLKIDQVPSVREFADVFPVELPRLRPDCELDFSIELLPRTTLITVSPYRIALTELKELKAQLRELVDRDFIRSSVSRWGALVLFVKPITLKKAFFASFSDICGTGILRLAPGSEADTLLSTSSLAVSYIENLENQIGQVATELRNRPGTLPSDMENMRNPRKEHCKALTLRSEKTLEPNTIDVEEELADAEDSEKVQSSVEILVSPEPEFVKSNKMRSHLNLRDVKAEEVPEATLDAVAETLRTSSSLRVFEDGFDLLGKKVGRSTALLEPEELLEQLDSRTIAALPFEFNVKMEDVEAFFGQYAKVNSVRLPRHVANKKYFCGTALIEFSTEEDAQKVLEQSLVYAGAELELKPKKDFDTIREEEAEEYEDNHLVTGSNGDNRLNAEDKYPKGLVVAFALKNISGGDSAEKNGSDEPAKDGATEKNEEKTTTNDEDKKDKVDDKQPVSGDETENKSPVQKDEGTEHKNTSVFKDDINVVLREDLKEAFQKFGTVKVDISLFS
ncbi:la protein 1-like [Gossypium hirsutum]|uniref:La protein 1-like n=1 Tax=Gossypium hirsutum TaxID=3635 RepID=A0ABM2ZXH4_GOSHI|nr:la protein 1-like [Gossypium hirsutum]